MKTKEVRPYKFSVHTILYNKDGFCIAYGKWENGPSRLAMRWNDDSNGFPNQDGSPVWFHLPEKELFTNEILKGILKIKAQENNLELKNVIVNAIV